MKLLSNQTSALILVAIGFAVLGAASAMINAPRHADAARPFPAQGEVLVSLAPSPEAEMGTPIETAPSGDSEFDQSPAPTF